MNKLKVIKQTLEENIDYFDSFTPPTKNLIAKELIEKKLSLKKIKRYIPIIKNYLESNINLEDEMVEYTNKANIVHTTHFTQYFNYLVRTWKKEEKQKFSEALNFAINNIN